MIRCGDMTEKVITLNNAGVRYIDINEITIEQENDHYRLGGGHGPDPYGSAERPPHDPDNRDGRL